MSDPYRGSDDRPHDAGANDPAGPGHPGPPPGASSEGYPWSDPTAPSGSDWESPSGTGPAPGHRPGDPATDYPRYDDYAGYAGGGPGAPPPYGQEPGPHPAGPAGPGTRPGIVPLRPLGVGDILGGAFAAMRHNPGTILGVSLLFYLVIGILSLVPALVTGDLFDLQDPANGPWGDAPVDAFQILSMVGSVVLTGFLIGPIVAAVAGGKPSPGEAWDHVKGRILPLFGLVVVEIVVAALLAVPFVAVGIALVAGAGDEVLGAVLGAVGLVVAYLLVLLLVFVLFAYAYPVVVVERRGPIASLRRSVRLVRHAYWRTLGILVLASILVGVASFVLVLPVTVLAAVLGALAGPTGMVVSGIVVGLLTVLVQAVTQPYSAGVNALLYVDRRMRTEGYAFELAGHADPRGRPRP